MNYTKLLLIPLLLLFAITGNAQNFGTFASGVFIKQNGILNTFNVTGDGTPNEIGPGAPGFSGSLGSFPQNSGTLTLAGAEVKTFKNPGANVCMPTLKYRIRQSAGFPQPYSDLSLPFKANCSGNVFDDGFGPCGGNDQKWSTQASDIDLTNLCAGNYILEAFYTVPGSSSSTNGCNESASIGSAATPAGSMTFTITNTLSATATAGPPVCAGGLVDLSGVGSGGIAPYTYQWLDENDASVSFGETTQVSTAGTYKVMVFDNCNNTAVSPPVTAVINPGPSAPILSGGTTICPGGSTTLFADNCDGDVTWSDGTAGSVLSTGAGTFTATCTLNGCVSPASAPITVTELNVAPPDVTPAASTVCVGATTTLTASNCSGEVTWSNGATGASIDAPAGTYTAVCAVKTGPGRFAPSCISAPSAEVTVTETPVAPPALSGGTTICPGGSTTLFADNCDGDVTWSDGTAGSALSTGAGTFTATCTLNGCVSPASAPITVTELNVAPPDVTPAASTVCVGATTTLTASNCSGQVTWSNGATGASIDAPAGTYTAVCAVKTGPGRFAPSCISAPSAEVTVTETPVAPPVISGNTAVCAGATTTLTASNCNGDVTWSTGATASTIDVPVGSYTATCTVNGCVSPASAPTDVTQLPAAAPLSVTVGPTTCPSGNATVTATGCGDGVVTWSTGATGASTPLPPGTYTVSCVTANPANGCSSTPTTVVVPPFASPCPSPGNLLKNPSFDSIHISGVGDNLVLPGWTETGIPNNYGKAEIWSNYYEGPTTKDGFQYVELNGVGLGVLSQTINVQPGAPLTFSFNHAARVSANPGGYVGEKLIVEFLDSTGTLITSLLSTATVQKVWITASTTFVPPNGKVTIRFKSLNGSRATATSLGVIQAGNLIDKVSLAYAGCICPCIPSAPVITTNTPILNKCSQQTATLTATGCDGGTLKWNTGESTTSITVNTPGSYTAQCILPGTTCASPASNPMIVTAGPDVQVTCPTARVVINGTYRIHYCIKNNGSAPATVKDTIMVNGSANYTNTHTIPGKDSVCIDYVQNFLACGSTVPVKVTAAFDGDLCPADNTCSSSFVATCFPPVVVCCGVGPDGWPRDPNVKRVSPMRSLEGGIFPSDEWLTYTIHCQNDGLGICHNAIMVDTIDTSKLDISTLQILSSWDPVQLTHINANTVSFDFIGVELTSSTNDLPNSQTEVIFKIKRLPNQPVGTEIFNKAGIYFDTQEVVNTEYAASKIIEPCPASQVSPGMVNSNIAVVQGTALNHTFTLSGYNGLITGWEVSTDSTFTTNVKKSFVIADTFAFSDTINTITYVRATVQTGGCAITGSQPARISLKCVNLVKNGSFEDPVLPSNGYANKKMPNWTNTADNNLMEVHRNTFASSTDGAQSIELNGTNFGNIYQDFTIAAGKFLNWRMDHRKREYANEKITVTLSAPDGSNASAPVQHVGITAWQTVAGSYQPAPGQTQVRIRIVSSGGLPGIGNLLDNVFVSYDGCTMAATALRAGNEVAAEQQATGNLSIIVHPNPVDAVADLKIEGFENGKVSVEVMSANGQLVNTSDVNYTQGTSIHMDMSHLHQGLYFVRVKQDGKMVTTKMVKN